MARPRKRREPKRKSVSLIYTRGTETIRYIDLPSDQLATEVKRLSAVMTEVLGLLWRVKRVKHPLVEYVRFQATVASASVPADLSTLTAEQYVSEIGRLNAVLNDSLQVLSKMKTPYAEVQEAVFRLQYGQTSRKREAGWNSFKRDRDDESIPDPEGQELEPDYD